MPTMSSRELRKRRREEQDNDKLLAELSGEPLDNDASFDPVVLKKQIFDSVNSTITNGMLGQHWQRYFIDIFSQFAPPDQGNPNRKEHRAIYRAGVKYAKDIRNGQHEDPSSNSIDDIFAVYIPKSSDEKEEEERDSETESETENDEYDASIEVVVDVLQSPVVLEVAEEEPTDVDVEVESAKTQLNSVSSNSICVVLDAIPSKPSCPQKPRPLHTATFKKENLPPLCFNEKNHKKCNTEFGKERSKRREIYAECLAQNAALNKCAASFSSYVTISQKFMNTQQTKLRTQLEKASKYLVLKKSQEDIIKSLKVKMKDLEKQTGKLNDINQLKIEHAKGLKEKTEEMTYRLNQEQSNVTQRDARIKEL